LNHSQNTINITYQQFVTLADFSGVIIIHEMPDWMKKKTIAIDSEGLCHASLCNPHPDGKAVVVLSLKIIKDIAEASFIEVYSSSITDDLEEMLTLDEDLSFDDCYVGLAMFFGKTPDEGFIPLGALI
jgi:hypothetical protein